MVKYYVTLAACGVLFVAGCEADKSITDPKPSTALVRVINATAVDTLDVATSGLVNSANAGLLFGASTGCLTVDATNPLLTVRKARATTDIAGLTPTFTAGHRYWVVAMSGAT